MKTTTIATLILMTTPVSAGIVVLDTTQDSREVYHETGQLMRWGRASSIASIAEVDKPNAQMRWLNLYMGRFNAGKTVYSFTEQVIPDDPFEPPYTVKTTVTISAAIPAIEMSADWGPIIRGGVWGTQAILEGTALDPFETIATLTVRERINYQPSTLVYTEEALVSYTPQGESFVTDIRSARGSTSWSLDAGGPWFRADDDPQFLLDINGEVRPFTLGDVQHSFEGVTWVPEPSAWALASIALIGLLCCRAYRSRQPV